MAFCDQVKALEILGMALLHHDGTPMEANEIPRGRDIAPLYEQNVDRTLASFLLGFPSTGCRELVIGHATKPRRCGGSFVSHTFALDRSWYFDNNTTEERPVPLSEACARSAGYACYRCCTCSATLRVRPMSISRMSRAALGGQAAHERRGGADRGEYRQAAGARGQVNVSDGAKQSKSRPAR